MVGKLSRCLMAAVLNMCATAAAAETDATGSIHREPVDVSAHPWSAIGKLFNEAGTACTGVIVARDKILTAAHCVFNQRTGRFLPPTSLHFMAGYRRGKWSAHARVARYDIGAGYDPQRWIETMAADWAILTLTDNLPAEIEPLKLQRDPAPSGTKATIAGYPQDRAHMMTADRDCELGERGRGMLVFHTCRGMRGYSGAPILVSAGDTIHVAGIHVAATGRDANRTMIAVSAQVMEQAVSQDRLVPRERLGWREASARVQARAMDSGWFE